MHTAQCGIVTIEEFFGQAKVSHLIFSDDAKAAAALREFGSHR